MSAATTNLERMPADLPMDETDVNLRAHLWRIPDERLAEYDPAWSDEQLMEWDGNFRDDGCLFLVCSERDVEVDEYRKVLEEHIRFRREAGGSA
jgi:hypothetical protein